MAGECRAFPRGQKWDEELAAWCLRNRHKAMCRRCKKAPAALPEESIYQREKREKKRNGVKKD